MADSAQQGSLGLSGYRGRKSADGSLLKAPSATHSNVILAVGLMAVLATLIIPLPTPLMDMLLACSISLAVAVLIVTLSSKEALELSCF
jgi:flagellar biosynthesis component FlhA